MKKGIVKTIISSSRKGTYVEHTAGYLLEYKGLSLGICKSFGSWTLAEQTTGLTIFNKSRMKDLLPALDDALITTVVKIVKSEDEKIVTYKKLIKEDKEK